MRRCYQPLKTYREDNQFHFVCPVFKADTAIATCFKLRELKWAGHRPTVRKGCQCAMEVGKCPIVAMVTRLARTDDDPYWSDTRKTGVLLDEDLEAIAAVAVPDRILRNYNLEDDEREMLIRANNDASKGRPMKKQRTASAPKMVEVATPVEPDPTTEAAVSGDLSAAINQAIKAEEHP